jgi:hypothetical protein
VVDPFVKEHNITGLTIYLDKTMSTMKAMKQTTILPMTLLIDADGNEIGRVPTPAQQAGLPVPLDLPSGIDFDGAGSIYFTNHAEFSGDPAHMVVFKTWVGDVAWPLARPLIF